MALQGGMFGPTPEELQYAIAQQQQDEDFRDAGAWGNKNLSQQISTGAYAGGMSIGRGLQSLGQATGYLPQDPRLAEAQKMMQIKKNIMESGIDPQDIDKFYPEMIKQMYQGGMIDKAIELEKQYRVASDTQDQILTRKLSTEASIKAKEEAARKMEDERRAVQGRASFIIRRNPDFSPEEAEGLAKDPGAFSKFIETPKIKTSVTSAGGRRLLINSDTGETIKDLGEAGKTIADGLSEGLSKGLGAVASAVNAKKAAEAAGSATGTAAGKSAADIQKQYDADTSVQDALRMMTKGIFSGPYGPMLEKTAKYSRGAVGDLNRVVNTEEFRSHMLNIVIPRLADFGGSDTEQELKKLEEATGSDTALEPRTIKNILASIDAKIKAKIARIKAGEEAARTGQPPPTGPMNTKKTIKKKTASGLEYEIEE